MPTQPQTASARMLRRNAAYTLQYVDLNNGFGLLYSPTFGDSVFLNPIASAFWTSALPVVCIADDAPRISEALGIADEQYVTRVLSDLKERGLLLAEGEQPQPPRKPVQADSVPPLGQIYLYITRLCNARCYHCYQPTTYCDPTSTRPNETLVSVDRILEVLRDALPLGLQKVKLSGGEPLLRREFRQIVAGARSLGVRVSIETNGYLLDESLADFLAEHNVAVSISLDGGSADVHDKLRVLPGSFDRVGNALRLLSERGMNPYTIMSVSRKNLQQVENVIEFATGNGCRHIKLNPVNTLGTAERLDGKDILLTIQDLFELHGRVKSLESKYDVFLFIEGPPAFASIGELVSGHAAACPFTEILGILADGGISFCGVGNSCPELVIGRIDEPGFQIRDFWSNNAVLRQVRSSSRPSAGVCSCCLLEAFCQGSCRALAYCHSKTFSGPHPWCQQAYAEGRFPSHYLKPVTQ